MNIVTRLLCLILLFIAFIPSGLAQQKRTRPWKIYVVAHNHVDIGYTQLISEVERTWCDEIDEALDLVERQNFKWTLESSLLFDIYARHRKPEKVERLVNAIRSGKIEVASLYTNIESENAGPEELVRSTSYSNSTLRRKYGIESHTAMISDVPGATWGLPRALAGAGVKYFLFGPGRYKNVHEGSEHPILFYWKSQDGSRVLTRLATGKYFFYASGRMFMMPAAALDKEVDEMLKYHEALGAAYPYDALLVQVSNDNGRPQPGLIKTIAEFNARHKDVQATLATASEFFRYIEEKFANKVPELSGDFTSGWSDMPGNFAEPTSAKRRAVSQVSTAEKFAAIGEMLGLDLPYPAQRIANIYKDLLVWTDHTYGLSTWNWEHDMLPQTGGDLSAPAWDHYKQSWEDKKVYAYRAEANASDITGDTLERIAARIPAAGKTVVVFNPLSWTRTDVVKVLSRSVKIDDRKFYLQDESTGEKIGFQVLGGDQRYNIIAFVAKNVPALGYKTYRVMPGQAPASDTVTVNGNTLENEFYRVTVDAETGGLKSIFDKELKRELVDTKGVERVNQYLYHSLTGGHEAIYNDNRGLHFGRTPASDFQTAVYTPLAARVVPGHTGAAFKSLRSEINMDHGPAPSRIDQEVILYPGLKRIDFVNRIRKQSTLNKEECYYAFPFAVENFEMNVELPGAVMRPGRDQLPGSFTGFSGIQHWADVSNKEFGVAVATRDVPAIEFGEIRTNDWSREYQPKRSAFYFYVMNNRWNTDLALWQGSDLWRYGFLELSFSVMSHRGGWRESNVTRFGWEHNTPLEARVIGQQEGTLPAAKATFSEGLPGNVVLQALKQAEDGNGYIARFYETGGKAAAITWSGLPLKAREAQLTDLLERPTGAARVENGRVIFSIRPFEIVNIRLLP